MLPEGQLLGVDPADKCSPHREISGTAVSTNRCRLPWQSKNHLFFFSEVVYFYHIVLSPLSIPDAKAKNKKNALIAFIIVFIYVYLF